MNPLKLNLVSVHYGFAMRQLLKDHNAWLWAAAIVAGVLSSLLPPAITNSPNALPVSMLILILTFAVAWWRWRVHQQVQRVAENQQQILNDLRHQEELRQQFALLKPARSCDLKTLDFNASIPINLPTLGSGLSTRRISLAMW